MVVHVWGHATLLPALGPLLTTLTLLVTLTLLALARLLLLALALAELLRLLTPLPSSLLRLR